MLRIIYECFYIAAVTRWNFKKIANLGGLFSCIPLFSELPPYAAEIQQPWHFPAAMEDIHVTFRRLT